MPPKSRKVKTKDHWDFLMYLRSISPRRQKYLIKMADRPILEAFSEIALNLIKKNISLTSDQINRLRPFEENIYQLSLKRHSVVKKKKILTQTGGFLSVLVSTLVPLIGALIGAIRK